MKKFNKIFNITITVIISFIAVIGVASATGIFYYNDVRNQIVFNANISLTGASLSKFMVNTINSDRNPLTLSGLQDLQFRFGKYDSASSFGLNNNINDRVFQIKNDGTMMIGTALTNATTVSAANAKFSVDANGSLLVRGSTRFTGGLIADGNIINTSGWNEILRFNGDTGVIAGPGSLGFTMDKTNGFTYGTDSANLTRLGDLTVKHQISTASLCLGTPGTADCRTSWFGSSGSPIVNTDDMATTSTVNTKVIAATKPFGGMYSIAVTYWPIHTNGDAQEYNGDAGTVTEEWFKNDYANADGIPTRTPAAGDQTDILNSTYCMKPNPANTDPTKCGCPPNYKPKRFFYRTFCDGRSHPPTCPRYYFFECTKP